MNELNNAEILVITGVQVAMQEFVDVWQNPKSPIKVVLVSYGGACFAVLLYRQVFKDTASLNAPNIKHAMTLLDQAAVQLGMPKGVW